jgi:hypothetical protein
MFVGAERRALVGELLQAYDTVAAGGGPQLWVITAPSGAGKSRVVHELYVRMAAERQGSHGDRPYWPARIATDGDGSPALVNRKLTHPHEMDGTQQIPAGVRIPWMWWGLNCLRSTEGGYGQVIFDDLTQLREHVGISGAEHREVRLHQRFEATGLTVGLVAGLLTIGGAALAVLLPLASIGQAMFRSRGRLRRHLQAMLDALQARRGIVRSRRVDVERAGRDREVEGITEAIVRCSADRAPFIIFIEDAQDADDGLVALLGRILASRKARVLVIATMWPDGGRDVSPMEDWLRRTRGNSLLGERCHEVSLRPIGPEDLRDLVEHLHRERSGRPELPDDATLGAIIERHGSSALQIHTLFAIPRTLRTLASRPLDLADLDGIPSDIRSLLHAYLSRFDDGTRVMLALAAHAGMRFVSEPIITQAGRMLPGFDLEARLRDATERHGVVHRRANGVLVFVDHAIWDVARTLADDHLTVEDLRLFRAELAAHSCRLAAADEPGPGAEVSWAIHLGLVQDGLVEAGPAVPPLTRLARLLAARSAFEDALAALATAIGSVGSPEERLELRALRIRWLLELARGEAALTEVEELLAGAIEPDQRLLLELLRVRALQECADLPRALAALAAVMPELDRDLPPTSAPVLSARHLEAVLLLRTGRADEARQRFTEVVALRSSVSGSSSRGTFAARTMAARATGESGRTHEAVALFRTLVDEQRRALGPNAPETFNARANLVRFLAESGAVTDARREATELLDDSAKEIGEDHPRTLARWNLRTLINEYAGHHQAAAEGFKEVLERKIAILGAEHLHTQITRMDLARNLLASDDPEAAAEVLEPLSVWTRAALDEPDPLRLSAEGTRVLARARSGRAGPEDVEELHGLVARATERLGRLAVPTVLLRNHLGQTLGALGDVSGALAVLGPLADEVEGRLGATHRHVLAIRSNVAHWSAATDPVRAMTRFRTLHADLVATFGADHPSTVRMANSLAVLET